MATLEARLAAGKQVYVPLHFAPGEAFQFDWGERWSLLTHADYSFGDSEGTWLTPPNMPVTAAGNNASQRSS